MKATGYESNWKQLVFHGSTLGKVLGSPTSTFESQGIHIDYKSCHSDMTQTVLKAVHNTIQSLYPARQMFLGIYWNQLVICPAMCPSVYKILVSIKALAGILTLSSIYTHFNMLKIRDLGKHCGKR